MTKAEKVAVTSYPHGVFQGEEGDSLRAACMLGYGQAEKDLALTWEDMKLIIAAEGSIYDENHGNSEEVFATYPTEEVFYEEILRRYQELKAERE